MIVAFLLLAPAALGWSPPRRLDPSAQAPVYSADAHGRFYALFARTHGSSFQLLFDRLGRRGGRGRGGERVDSASSPAGGDYSLALAPSGRGLAVWCSHGTSGSSPAVYAAVRTPGGRFGTPQQLAEPVPSSGVGDNCNTGAAAGPGGGLVAVWRRTGTPRNRLEAATVERGGSRFHAAERLDSKASGSNFPLTATVDAHGRATVAWLAHGQVMAARQSGSGAPFRITRAAGSACKFGPVPIRLATADDGRSVLLFGRCVGSGRHVLELARARAGGSFANTQRIVKTRFAESNLVMNRRGQLIVTWRSLNGHLFATPGNARSGARKRQQITPHGPTHYKPGVDTHAIAIDGRGHATIAWRQRSLRHHASVRVRKSNARGHFGGHVYAFGAPGAVGVDVAMNAGGDAAVAWDQPVKSHRRAVDRIVAITRKPTRAFELPQRVARGRIEPVGLLASSQSLLLTWVSQPNLAAFSSVGRFHGR
jgi:hypothetical protein